MLSNSQEKIMILLTKLWKNSPEQRFNQFLYNLHRDFSKLHNDKCAERLFRQESKATLVVYSSVDVIDPFNIKDNEFLDFLSSEVVKLEGIALPTEAKLKSFMTYDHHGIKHKFDKGDVVTVIKKCESDLFGSGIGYVILNSRLDSLSVDSAHLDFYYKEGK